MVRVSDNRFDVHTANLRAISLSLEGHLSNSSRELIKFKLILIGS